MSRVTGCHRDEVTRITAVTRSRSLPTRLALQQLANPTRVGEGSASTLRTFPNYQYYYDARPATTHGSGGFADDVGCKLNSATWWRQPYPCGRTKTATLNLTSLTSILSRRQTMTEKPGNYSMGKHTAYCIQDPEAHGIPDPATSELSLSQQGQ